MDERRELARRMREMAVNTGGLNCLGCGYEHSCGVHGCAVLKRAADLLAPKVDITTPIPLEELRAAAAERPVLVFVLCVDENGQLEPPEYGEWEMFFDGDFIADGIHDTTDNYGRTFWAYWDDPGEWRMAVRETEKGATFLDKLCHKFYNEPKGTGYRVLDNCRSCGGMLETYYCEEQLYLVRCTECGALSLVKAGSPVEAAARTLGVGGG